MCASVRLCVICGKALKGPSTPLGPTVHVTRHIQLACRPPARGHAHASTCKHINTFTLNPFHTPTRTYSQAFDEADRVWAVYSYFCWKPVAAGSSKEAALRGA